VPTKKEKQPLSITHPGIAKEADGWDPSQHFAGSSEKMKWCCPKGHNFDTRISHRTTGKSVCPVCSNYKILVGFNDLLTTHPEVAKEADGWDPTTVIAGTHKKKKWKCSNLHSFESEVVTRTGKEKTGCPFCANKKVLKAFNDLLTTHPEVAKEADGWDPTTVIAGSRVKKKWLCPNNHSYSAQISSRTRKLNTGCPICSNQQVLIGLNDLATTHPGIASEASEWDPRTVVAGSNLKKKWECPKGHKYFSIVASRTGRSSGCSVCLNHSLEVKFNDLATTHPELASEADGWDPQTVMAGNQSKKKWLCPLGHSYISAVNLRSGPLKTGCTVCANKVLLKGFNDLASTRPHIAKEAIGWNPESVFAGSRVVKEWKCQAGHIFKMALFRRTGRGSGCQTCSTRGFNPNQEGYLYFIFHSDWEMYQIGITNTPDNRLSNHQKTGWSVMEIRGPMDGYLTQQWETAILRMLKANGADIANEKIAGKFDGYSEAWSKSTFEIKSIKELMKLTEEFEEN
jgi:hypothetical protein